MWSRDGAKPAIFDIQHVWRRTAVFQGKADFGDIFPKTRVYCSQPARVAEPGDILISVRAPVGPTNLARQRCCIGRGLSALRPTKHVDTAFLFYFLRFYEPQLAKRGLGSTFAAINRDELEDTNIVLPDLSEQKRITKQLECADWLRRIRRYALELSDTFLSAAFLQLFGDPKPADFRYKKVPLEELCTKVTDGSHHTPTYIEQGVPFLSVKNVNTLSGQIDFKNTKYISLAAHKDLIKRCKPERDDVLYTKVGATYGIPKRIDTDVDFSIFVSLALLKPNKSRILPRYLESILKSDFVIEQARRLVSGIGVPDLHLREIKTFEIPTPSLEEQQRFADFAEEYERLRARHREALRQADHLFQSLLHRAFSDNG